MEPRAAVLQPRLHVGDLARTWQEDEHRAVAAAAAALGRGVVLLQQQRDELLVDDAERHRAQRAAHPRRASDLLGAAAAQPAQPRRRRLAHRAWRVRRRGRVGAARSALGERGGGELVGRALRRRRELRCLGRRRLGLPLPRLLRQRHLARPGGARVAAVADLLDCRLEEGLVHREGAPRDVDEPRTAAKVGDQRRGVKRGRHEHEAQRGAAARRRRLTRRRLTLRRRLAVEHAAQREQAEVELDGALVHLVDHDVRHAVERARALLEHAQQHARRHEGDRRVGAALGLATDHVATRAAHAVAHLGGDALGQRGRREPARLRDEQSARDTTGGGVGEDELRHLRRLAAPRRPKHKPDLPLVEHRHERLAVLVGWQLLPLLEHACVVARLR